MRFFGASRTQRSKALGIPLPSVGPYANLKATTDGLRNLIVPDGGLRNLGITGANTPARFNLVDIGAAAAIFASGRPIFIWCNILRIRSNSFIFADGANGDGSFGGFGGCGGGGAAFDEFGAGANGGNGGDGADPNGLDGQNNGGSGGTGYILETNFGTFSFGLGGLGNDGETVTDGLNIGFAGSGGSNLILGAGCGGGGGGAINGEFGGGGGGGGSLICIVANEIERVTAGGVVFFARGGGGFETFSLTGGAGGGGGGGCTWIAARKHSGNTGLDPNVFGGNGVYGLSNGTAGQADVFQILSDNSLTAQSFTTLWG